MPDVTSTADPAPTGLPETSAGAVVDHREYDATVDAGYEGEDVPDPDSPIKFQFSWRKLWRVRACESRLEAWTGGASLEPLFEPGRPNQHGRERRAAAVPASVCCHARLSSPARAG